VRDLPGSTAHGAIGSCGGRGQQGRCAQAGERQRPRPSQGAAVGAACAWSGGAVLWRAAAVQPARKSDLRRCARGARGAGSAAHGWSRDGARAC